MKRTKWILGVLVFVVVLAGLIALPYYFGDDSCLTTPATEMDIGGHEDLAMHIHPTLEIVIDGERQEIPAGIGLTFNEMRPIHTHDATGKIHIEAPCEREFTLREFFAVWGKQFNSQCIFDSCVADGGTLVMFVNGDENDAYDNLILRDDDEIQIVYTGA